MDIGRVCVKTAGRETGEKCVVVDQVDKKTVVVAGPRVRKRKCGIVHLELTPETVKVKKGASREEACKALGTEPPQKSEKKQKKK